MEDKIVLQRFSGKREDWPQWKRSFEGFLLIKELEITIERNNIDDLDRNNDDHKKLLKADKKLDFYLRQLLPSHVIGIIDRTFREAKKPANFVDGARAWHAIDDYFKKQNSLDQAQAFHKLSRVQLSEFRNCEDYLNQIEQLVAKCNAVDANTITTGTHKSIIINGLGPEWENFVTSNIKDTTSVSDLIDMILSRERFLQTEKQKVTALFSHENRKPGTRGRGHSI